MTYLCIDELGSSFSKHFKAICRQFTSAPCPHTGAWCFPDQPPREARSLFPCSAFPPAPPKAHHCLHGHHLLVQIRFVVELAQKERNKESAPAKRAGALRKGSLSSKLAQVSHQSRFVVEPAQKQLFGPVGDLASSFCGIPPEVYLGTVSVKQPCLLPKQGWFITQWNIPSMATTTP
eukprot:1144581-Pelagomonas_calceolata.AAC.6